MAFARMIFPNLPVRDLPRTKAFFTALGFSYNPQFTDDNAAALIINETTSVMLLKEEYFKTFTTRPLGDPQTHTQVLLALSCESREEVDRMVQTALANGGSPAMPAQDMGFMYGWSFYDPEGHHWEVFFMNPDFVMPAA